MKLQFKWHLTIHEVPAQEWNELAMPHPYPFLEWEWLAALETSGCVQAKAGWQPAHLTLRRGGILIAAAALYIKGHSRGEFIFDQEWANVAYSLGIAYYPKLLGMSPFTPAPGYRFLIAPGEDEHTLCAMILAQIDSFCQAQNLSSCHFLHTDPQWAAHMMDAGMNSWLHHHLAWENKGYKHFDDYLASFKSKQRKNVKRERRRVSEQNISMQMVDGQEAGLEMYQNMYQFYAETCRKFWSCSHYLNEAFFEILARDFGDRIVFAVARGKNGAKQRSDTQLPSAMSFLVHKAGTVYGRYWGCRRYFDYLHFETCYYQPIEWAIGRGIQQFDAGSGNTQHKKARGFPARPNCSLHRHYHPTMQQVWADHIDAVNEQEAKQIEAINQRTTPKRPARNNRNHFN